jgi:hypothetical protein
MRTPAKRSPQIRCPVILALFLALLLAFPALSSAQLVLGQYEDEAPLQTWNIFGFQTAPSLGRGETGFTIASDCSAALTNPALLADLPRLTATLNATSYYTSLYKFSIINTGVLSTGRNPSFTLYALDFGGLSYQFKGWALAVTVALVEIYERPSARYEASYNGQLYYTLDFHQNGVLRNTNLSVAHKIGSRFQAGVGFNLVSGDLTREVTETYLDPGVTISDNKSQDFSGFFLNGGIAAKITDKWRAALVFRTPFSKKSQSKSDLDYSAPAGGTNIKISADSSDTYKQPFVLGLGASYTVSPEFQVFSDLTYFNWSAYKVVYFGEEKVRNFKDTLKFGLGAEYSVRLRVFQADASVPLRAGLVYDPQPMKEPGSSYIYFSVGTGLHWKMIALDFGASFGRESGSGNSLEARRISLSLSVQL